MTWWSKGNLPPDIRGCWYQSVPDPQYPPKLGQDTFLSGDGMVRSFAFDGEGHVDFKQRYIRTERWLLEHQARKALFGAYRNPYTDDPERRRQAPRRRQHHAIFPWRPLLAFKEDSPPWEVDPQTLETVGEWTFGGRLRSQTVTAHPRLDPATGEMHYFGYEATGLATSEVSYFVTNAKGELIREEFFKVPYCALMHDFVVTKEHVVFPGFPIVADLERMKAGGDHWAWDATKESFIGIMPRKGKVERHALVPRARLFGIPLHQWLQRRQQGARGHVPQRCAGLRVHARGRRPAHSAAPGRRRPGALDV